MTELNPNQQKQLRTIITELADGLFIEEKILGNQYHGVRAEIKANWLPSPVEVWKDPQYISYRLKADWELPKKLRTNTYLSLGDIGREAKKYLSQEAMADFTFQKPKEEREMFVKEKEKKEKARDLSQKRHVNHYTTDLGLDVLEVFNKDYTVGEFRHKDIESIIFAEKAKNDFFFEVSADFDLPHELVSRFSALKDVAKVIEYCISLDKFGNKKVANK